MKCPQAVRLSAAAEKEILILKVLQQYRNGKAPKRIAE
jgi:hypothetical protein